MKRNNILIYNVVVYSINCLVVGPLCTMLLSNWMSIPLSTRVLYDTVSNTISQKKLFSLNTQRILRDFDLTPHIWLMMSRTSSSHLEHNHASNSLCEFGYINYSSFFLCATSSSTFVWVWQRIGYGWIYFNAIGPPTQTHIHTIFVCIYSICPFCICTEFVGRSQSATPANTKSSILFIFRVLFSTRHFSFARRVFETGGCCWSRPI